MGAIDVGRIDVVVLGHGGSVVLDGGTVVTPGGKVVGGVVVVEPDVLDVVVDSDVVVDCPPGQPYRARSGINT